MLRHAECRILFIIKLNVIMLSVIMLNVIMLSVVMLSVIILIVVAPVKATPKVAVQNEATITIVIISKPNPLLLGASSFCCK